MSIKNPNTSENLSEDGERILHLMENLGIKEQTAFARKLGVQIGYINDVIHGRKGISKECALKISSEFGVSLEWLLYGRGNAWPTITRAAESGEVYDSIPNDKIVDILARRLAQLHPNAAPIILTDDPEDMYSLEGREVYRAIPYMADAAAAGSGRLMREEVAGYVVVHERIARRPENLVAVRITGESMKPTLPDGSIVAIDLTKKNPSNLNGRIVCARLEDGEVLIKRLEIDGDHVLLKSDNIYEPQYTTTVVDLGPEVNVDDAIIGKVIWAWVDLT